MKKHAIWGLITVSFIATASFAAEGDRVTAIKARGELVCGTSTGTAIGLERFIA